MVKSMKQMDPLHNRSSSLDWQVLGEIKRPVSADPNRAIHNWLLEILHPLDLPPDFLNKITTSAQDCILRAIQAETVNRFEHIRLVIFAPRENVSKRRCWGFFRIEKMDENAREYIFEYYLYEDGISHFIR